MSFYSGLATTAGRLLEKYGQSITLTRTTGKSVNPVTGVITTGSETVYIVNGILKLFPDQMIDGDRILDSDKLLVIDDTVAPLISDQITFNSQDWNIADIQTSEPAGTPLVYFVRIRK